MSEDPSAHLEEGQSAGGIASLARGLRLMDVLWEHYAQGLTSGEVARAARETPSYATRALQTLAAAGWVERIAETERWRPAVRAVRRLNAVRRSLDTADQRLSELRQRSEAYL